MAYGWTLSTVLSMPASQFFAMRGAAFKLKALERIEECDIQAISICNHEWYDHVRNKYEWAVKGPEVPPPVLDAGSDDAKYAMMALFSIAKG